MIKNYIKIKTVNGIKRTSRGYFVNIDKDMIFLLMAR